MIPFFILLGMGALFLSWYIVTYNRCIFLMQEVKKAWSGIDVQIKKRMDLLPNLVNSVKGYASHEAKTLENIIAKRSEAFSSPLPTKEFLAEENMISGALKNLFALSENYPDLKANQNFLHLQSEISSVEENISAARRLYNSNVSQFNSYILSFPVNMIASWHSFFAQEFFELASEQRSENVSIQF